MKKKHKECSGEKANGNAGKQELNANSKRAQIEFCNVAKLREALAEARRFVFASAQCSDRDLLVDDGVHAPYVLTPKETLAKIDAALAAPLRQCDMGTAEEQSRRFCAFCRPRLEPCDGCPCLEGSRHGRCEFVWAQMPYESEEPRHD